MNQSIQEMMKKIVFLYGGLGALLLVVPPVLAHLLAGGVDPANFQRDEIIGYSSMVLAMGLVFLGVRQYKRTQGQLSFWQGVGLGLMIAAIPSLAFALYNYVFVTWMAPDFMDIYFEQQLAQLQTTLSPEAFEARRQQMEEEKNLYTHPGFSSLLMFLTVFVMGIIASLLSAIVLQSRPTVPS